MASHSINDFMNLFRNSTPTRIDINSLSNVQNIYKETKREALDRELSWKGLFFLEVTRSQEGSRFILTPTPDAFVEAADDLFDRGQVLFFWVIFFIWMVHVSGEEEAFLHDISKYTWNIFAYSYTCIYLYIYSIINVLLQMSGILHLQHYKNERYPSTRNTRPSPLIQKSPKAHRRANFIRRSPGAGAATKYTKAFFHCVLFC